MCVGASKLCTAGRHVSSAARHPHAALPVRWCCTGRSLAGAGGHTCIAWPALLLTHARTQYTPPSPHQLSPAQRHVWWTGAGWHGLLLARGRDRRLQVRHTGLRGAPLRAAAAGAAGGRWGAGGCCGAARSATTTTSRLPVPHGHPVLLAMQAAGVPYAVDIIVEATDESVAGVGEAICRKADDLQAAAASRAMCMCRGCWGVADGWGCRSGALWRACSLPRPAALLSLQVVMGSHVNGGLLQFMLGSVATYCTQHCRRPVAVLH